MIYLDNAATSGKKPEGVIRAVNTALIKYSANPGRGGHTPSIKAAEQVYEVRRKLSDMFNAPSPERVIFTPSCTYSLNAVIKGVLKNNDRMVISSLEHNAVYRPAVTVNRLGAGLDIAEVIFGDSEATVRSFKRSIKPGTRLVVCTHASNVTGEIMPIKEIGSLCKENGILFCVDAAQTAGVLPIDMQEMNIDFLCVAPHKGLYGPMGSGVLIAAKDIDFTIIEGGTGVSSLSPYQPELYPERLESGTVNLPGIVGIGAGVDFVKAKGLNKIYSSELRLINKLYEGISDIADSFIYSPYPKAGECVPLISFNLSNFSSTDMAARLGDMGFAVRGGLHCSPLAHKRLGTTEKGTVRVSPSVFNKDEDIIKFIWAVKKISYYN